MAPSILVQRRTHNLLLFQKLLNLRDGASPFTLLLDTLEQPAKPVADEFMTRAKVARSKIVFVSFETLRKPAIADILVRGNGKSLVALSKEILSNLPPPLTSANAAVSQKVLLLVDNVHSLASTAPSELPGFFFSFLSPGISVIATWHLDVPLPAPSNPYAPSALTTLAYLATAILRITSLDHTIQQKRSRDRSLPEPVFGIAEGRDGVLIGNKELGHDAQGVVVVMEIRRKSGRGVRETFVLAPASSSLPSALEAAGKMKTGPSAGSSILLLDDHPLYAAPEVGESALDADEGEDGPESTFNLGLTEKQKKDREGVVLPYFDAQNGGTEGGRILYEMGREDDWDPEEDEI